MPFAGNSRERADVARFIVVPTGTHDVHAAGSGLARRRLDDRHPQGRGLGILFADDGRFASLLEPNRGMNECLFIGVKTLIGLAVGQLAATNRGRFVGPTAVKQCHQANDQQNGHRNGEVSGTERVGK